MSVTLVTIIEHPIAQKYLERSGLNHAISVAEQALTLATQRGLGCRYGNEGCPAS